MTVEIVYSGDFVIDNKVSMRTIAQTCTGMQKALERAYLDIERGGLSKRDTIRDDERKATEFYLESYREGSFITKFKEITPRLKKAIDRLSSTISSPYKMAIQEGDIESQKIIQEAKDRLSVLESQPQKYEEAINNRGIYTPRRYAQKSILNHFNESLGPIKNSEGDNFLEFRLIGESSHEFYFDEVIATRFTKAYSGKELGPEIEYESYVIKLDTKNQKGVIRHKSDNKEATILFVSNSDYNIATEYLKTSDNGQPLTAMKFIGYAVKEFNVLDLACGDVVFRRIVGE